MANSYIHAKSSARRYGGKPEDYQELHTWFDQTKSAYADQRHRAILHNTFGIFLCEQVFGPCIRTSDGKDVPTRLIAEQHVIEDCGFIPTLENWLDQLPRKDWMVRGARPLSKILENLEAAEAEAAADGKPVPCPVCKGGTIESWGACDYCAGAGTIIPKVAAATPDLALAAAE